MGRKRCNFTHTACRCPYYRTAEHGLYATLTLGDTDNQGDYFDAYWSTLTTTTLTTAQCGIDLPGYPDKFKSAFMADPNNPTCGEYLQFTSQYPGKGPCYPVLVATVDHLNRCQDCSMLHHLLFLDFSLFKRWYSCRRLALPCFLCMCQLASLALHQSQQWPQSPNHTHQMLKTPCKFHVRHSWRFQYIGLCFGTANFVLSLQSRITLNQRLIL